MARKREGYDTHLKRHRGSNLFDPQRTPAAARSCLLVQLLATGREITFDRSQVTTKLTFVFRFLSEIQNIHKILITEQSRTVSSDLLLVLFQLVVIITRVNDIHGIAFSNHHGLLEKVKRDGLILIAALQAEAGIRIHSFVIDDLSPEDCFRGKEGRNMGSCELYTVLDA